MLINKVEMVVWLIRLVIVVVVLIDSDDHSVDDCGKYGGVYDGLVAVIIMTVAV